MLALVSNGPRSKKRDRGELTQWLEYIAEGLYVTLNKAWTRVQSLTAEKGTKKIILLPKQEQLLHTLRERMSLTPREIWVSLGVSKQGAMNLLNPLMETGLIRRIGTRKSGRYILA